MGCRDNLRNLFNPRCGQASVLNQIPNLQMIRTREPRHRVQTQILPAPFDLLVILVFHAAQGSRLFLGQSVPVPQFAEALSEKSGGSKVVGHLRRLRILRANEHRPINTLASIQNGAESFPADRSRLQTPQ